MPDHLHLVLEGEEDDSDLLEFVRRFKQVTAYAWKQRGGHAAWQRSFYDHVLRDSEDTRDIVRYVLENPVRAGLATSPWEYARSGSLIYSREHLIEWAFGWGRADAAV